MPAKLVDSRGTQIDTEQCVKNIGTNRFDLVLIAAARAREIRRRHSESQRREHVFATVTALIEVQEGTVGREYLGRV